MSGNRRIKSPIRAQFSIKDAKESNVRESVGSGGSVDSLTPPGMKGLCEDLVS